MTALSNWREEFNLSEVVTGKMTDTKALQKVSEKSGIKNKVTINPKLDEAVKEIGGEVISMTEADTTSQKQRLDMKQMILDRQKLKLRRKDMSAAKQEKKQGVEGESTGALKQGNVIAAEGVLSMIGRGKKKEEKKPQKAMDAGARVRRAMKRREHAKYVSGSTDNVPDDIREGVKGQSKEARREMAAERRTKGDPMNQEGDPSKRLTAKQGRRSVKPIRSWSKQISRYRYNEGEDKAFNYVVAKLKKQHGDGVLTKGDKIKPPTAAQKKANAAQQAKVDKENAAERAKDPSQGRYPKG